MELAKRFNFKEVENVWCQYWEKNRIFHAEPNTKKKPYTIVIPPPNITGILHMGHALNNTLQDIIIRYKRMKGFEACWMPGTDHAGIATQNVVEKDLAKAGEKRQDIGREKFIELLWNWRKEYGDTIIHQLKKLGASCDWERTSFTMDDSYSEAVVKVFVSLYKKGLIYRGQYIINWCPRCQTALSDEEAEHQEVQGTLTYIKYQTKDDPSRHIVIATTRPETMLGDTAVAVNPKDKRYKPLIGKTLILPVLNREIKIIADDFVDPEFGTGAVKVTPAHDPNDFAMGQRHKLDFINIMYPDGRLNKEAGDFAEMDRFEAREALVKTLRDLKLVEKIEPHSHAVGHCYRCETVVEPYLSKQWFVKMGPLAKPAVDVVKKGKIKFHPNQWSKVYLNWMENIRDWCISRQIWWGHRIPVWYCIGDDHCKLECKEPIVSEKPPEKCPHCGSKNLQQDPDVLDTWFSSWLWPFATFGWPQTDKDTKFFYPGNSLFTASEIIFFWVARMIMAGKEFMNDIPFEDVYIHGTVRDAQGRKMSKSLGNALDPLEIIDEYGADALRFSLIINSGQDLYISKEKFEIGRNFANKVWNASRFVLMNTTIEIKEINLEKDIDVKKLDLSSRWILSRFYSMLEAVENAVERYRYSEAESLVYDFFWKNYCDWYLEIIKNNFSDKNIQCVALGVLQSSLKVLHPFMPFVTEELWKNLNISDTCMSRQEWPKHSKKTISSEVEKSMHSIIEIITSVRNLRAQWNIKPQEKINCHFYSTNGSPLKLIEENTNLLKSQAKINELYIEKKGFKSRNSITGLVEKIKFSIPLGDIIDIEKEKKRIMSETVDQKKMLNNLSKRLKNKDFVKKAPKEVVEKDKDRMESLKARIEELESVISNLE